MGVCAVMHVIEAVSLAVSVMRDPGSASGRVQVRSDIEGLACLGWPRTRCTWPHSLRLGLPLHRMLRELRLLVRLRLRDGGLVLRRSHLRGPRRAGLQRHSRHCGTLRKGGRKLRPRGLLRGVGCRHLLLLRVRGRCGGRVQRGGGAESGLMGARGVCGACCRGCLRRPPRVLHPALQQVLLVHTPPLGSTLGGWKD